MSTHPASPNAFPRQMVIPSGAQLNAASHKNSSAGAASRMATPLLLSRPLVNFAGGQANLPSRPTTQPPPRTLAPEIKSPRPLPSSSIPPEKKPESTKRKRLESDEEEEEEDYDDDEESEDSDEEDDSIVVSDNEEVEFEEKSTLPTDDSDPESARKLAEILKEEAQSFIKENLKVSCVGGRPLRDRNTLKKPDQSHLELIREAYELDEKKELIREMGIWRKTLEKEANSAGVVWKQLKSSMPIDEIRKEHDIIRRRLGLEASDDEDSEEEAEDDEDETASMEEENEEEDDDSSSSSSGSSSSESENE